MPQGSCKLWKERNKPVLQAGTGHTLHKPATQRRRQVIWGLPCGFTDAENGVILLTSDALGVLQLHWCASRSQPADNGTLKNMI